jgi:hypothetical protein
MTLIHELPPSRHTITRHVQNPLRIAGGRHRAHSDVLDNATLRERGDCIGVADAVVWCVFACVRFCFIFFLPSIMFIISAAMVPRLQFSKSCQAHPAAPAPCMYNSTLETTPGRRPHPVRTLAGTCTGTLRLTPITDALCTPLKPKRR